MKFYVKTKLSENISETPEGFLLCRNVMLTHTGALKYASSEHPFGEEFGEVIMKRDPEELFSEATMASFEGKDITIQHPEDFIDPDNYQELTKGVLFNVRKGKEEIEVEGEKVLPMLGDILVKAKDAIEAVKAGLREVSLGYEAVWELISKSEGRHTKIVGNHCALVDEGRAGKHCAINDHKHKENEVMGLKEMFEKFKKLTGKSVDQAIDEKKKSKANDEKEQKQAEEFKKLFGKTVDEYMKDEEEKEKKEKESEDESEEEQAKEDEKFAKLAERLMKLEELVAKLVKGEDEEESEESEEIVADEEESESEDEESEDEGSEDEVEEKKEKAGDSVDVLSRAEILAPGIKKSKDIKAKALAEAYKSEDGKKIIDTLTGGKELSKLKGVAVDAVFNAAAEMMKSKRTKDFASQRVTTIDSFPALKGTGSMTAEDINKKNAEFYGKK